jgi:SAM-dependent methyltransferase
LIRSRCDDDRQSLNVGFALSATCLLCGAADVQQVLEPRKVPIFQNRIFADPAAARAIPRAEVVFSFCRRCGLVFNSSFGGSRLDYSSEYDNSQTCSPFYQTYLDEIAKHLTDSYALKDKTILEIGCGKGTLLRLLCRGGRNRGVGFDPSYVGPPEAEGGAVRFVREFYDRQRTDSPVDLVVCQHVMDHLADSRALLAQMRSVTIECPGAAVFCEVPDMAWILEKTAFWDLCYERCSYFFPETLTWAFRQAGFEVVRTVPAFHGQYFWLEARPASREQGGVDFPGGLDSLKSRVEVFSWSVKTKMADCAAILEQFHSDGGCAVWGGATKGAMLLNLLDPERQLVRYVVDINPTKHCSYVPGTGHAIVPPARLLESPVAGILVMNPNYLGEIKETLQRLGVAARLECA